MGGFIVGLALGAAIGFAISGILTSGKIEDLQTELEIHRMTRMQHYTKVVE